ncbi:Ist2p SCDLUD_000771 [Saccharomycodes ludwigii]|uniref:Ist2p n=1 Tax=Saccharomycodes ludwigii TaxID=36035 RepID=UPI001E8A6BB3|nr:hypothetical protein SCDLUD_000771 [Saccharomycodes ludwigii]KAH3903157.1 hypothetical protein SCDLUD_000771 [Saccharomycodes ludwigii]
MSSSNILVTQLDPNYIIAIKTAPINVKSSTNETINKIIFAINTEIDPKAQLTTRPGINNSTSFIIFVQSSLSDFITKFNDNAVTRTLAANSTSFKVYPIDTQTEKKLKAQYYKKNLGFLKINGQNLFFLKNSDLAKINEFTNTEVSLYFYFVQNYICSLIPLSLIGCIVRYIANKSNWEFNYFYTGFVFLWSCFTINYWKYNLEPNFNSKIIAGEKKIVKNELNNTGSNDNIVFLKKLLFSPIALTFLVCLLCFQLICFFIEIFLTQIYDGKGKMILALLPTVLISVYIPLLTKFYNTVFVGRFVAWENSKDPEKSKIIKNFILVFMSNYGPLLITLFLYLPKGYLLNPELNSIRQFVSKYNIPVIQDYFEVDVNRYRSQYFYFTFTAQIIGIVTTNVLPILLEYIMCRLQGSTIAELDKINRLNDRRESVLLIETRKMVLTDNNSAWGSFNPTGDINYYSKFILQFGFIIMFSTIWPLAPMVCLVLNVVMFKCDLWRLFNKCTKLETTANDTNYISIQPWNEIIYLLFWLSTLVSPALIVMYKYTYLPNVGVKRGDIFKRDLWFAESPIIYDWGTIFTATMIFEHIGFLINYIVSHLYATSSNNKRNVNVTESNRLNVVALNEKNLPANGEKVSLINPEENTSTEASGTTREFNSTKKSNDIESVSTKKNSSAVVLNDVESPTMINSSISSDSSPQEKKSDEVTVSSDPTNVSVPLAETKQENLNSKGESALNTESSQDIGQVSKNITNKNNSAIVNTADTSITNATSSNMSKNHNISGSGGDTNKKTDIIGAQTNDTIANTTTATNNTAHRNKIDNFGELLTPIDSSSIAGATLPSIIPTSENYDLRKTLQKKNTMNNENTKAKKHVPTTASSLSLTNNEGTNIIDNISKKDNINHVTKLDDITDVSPTVKLNTKNISTLDTPIKVANKKTRASTTTTTAISKDKPKATSNVAGSADISKKTTTIANTDLKSNGNSTKVRRNKSLRNPESSSANKTEKHHHHHHNSTATVTKSDKHHHDSSAPAGKTEKHHHQHHSGTASNHSNSLGTRGSSLVKRGLKTGTSVFRKI